MFLLLFSVWIMDMTSQYFGSKWAGFVLPAVFVELGLSGISCLLFLLFFKRITKPSVSGIQDYQIKMQRTLLRYEQTEKDSCGYSETTFQLCHWNFTLKTHKSPAPLTSPEDSLKTAHSSPRHMEKSNLLKSCKLHKIWWVNFQNQ